MKPRHIALLVALLMLPAIPGGDRPGQESNEATPAAARTKSPAFAAGQILTLDASGKIDHAQQAADVETILGDAISTSSEGLVVETSKVPGGGRMVNLQGRFQSAMTMSIDANGNTSAPCVPATAAPAKGEVK